MVVKFSPAASLTLLGRGVEEVSTAGVLAAPRGPLAARFCIAARKRLTPVETKTKMETFLGGQDGAGVEGADGVDKGGGCARPRDLRTVNAASGHAGGPVRACLTLPLLPARAKRCSRTSSGVVDTRASFQRTKSPERPHLIGLVSHPWCVSFCPP